MSWQQTPVDVQDLIVRALPCRERVRLRAVSRDLRDLVDRRGTTNDRSVLPDGCMCAVTDMVSAAGYARWGGRAVDPWAQALTTEFGVTVEPAMSVTFLQRAYCEGGTHPFVLPGLMTRDGMVWMGHGVRSGRLTPAGIGARAEQLRELLSQHGSGWTMHNGQYSLEWMGQWILNDLHQVLPLGTWTLDRYVSIELSAPATAARFWAWSV